MAILNEIVELVRTIPDTVWGIVLGSFFSLGGVLLTNRGNTRRLQQQLNHDRVLKERERELSMRKDIYLSASEAVLEAINMFHKLPDLHISNDKLSQRFVERSAALAKVYVIGKDDTVRAFLEFTNEHNAGYLRLSSRRILLTHEKARKEALEEQIASFRRERDQMHELMKQLNLEGKADPQRCSVIENAFKFEQERIAKAGTQLQEMVVSHRKNILQFVHECASEAHRVKRFMLPVLVAVRTELELPFNSTEFEKLLSESDRVSEACIKDFCDSLSPKDKDVLA